MIVQFDERAENPLTEDIPVTFQEEGKTMIAYVDTVSEKLKEDSIKLIPNSLFKTGYELTPGNWHCTDGKGGGFACTETPKQFEVNYKDEDKYGKEDERSKNLLEFYSPSLYYAFTSIMYRAEIIKDNLNEIGSAVHYDESTYDLSGIFPLLNFDSLFSMFDGIKIWGQNVKYILIIRVSFDKDITTW